jgi:hypothetical protein
LWRVIAPSPAGRTQTRGRYRAHGIELECDFPLDLAPPAPPDGGPCRRIAVTPRPPEIVRELWSGPGEGPTHRTVLSDGEPLTVERGVVGDHLIGYGAHPFHLSTDLGTLSCSPPEREDAGWQRTLLDWVTYFAAVLSGTECIHASAVEVGGRALAFAAPSGAGKTTLAAELVAGGATFLCDDVLAVELRDGEALAHPGPPFAAVDKRDRRLAERLGAARATLGEELWVSVERRANGPAPVAAIVLLDRREGGPDPAAIGPASFIALRNLAIGLPHLRGREARRFATLAALAEQASLLRLRASAALPAAELARSIETRLAEEGVL